MHIIVIVSITMAIVIFFICMAKFPGYWKECLPFGRTVSHCGLQNLNLRIICSALKCNQKNLFHWWYCGRSWISSYVFQKLKRWFCLKCQEIDDPPSQVPRPTLSFKSVGEPDYDPPHLDQLRASQRFVSSSPSAASPSSLPTHWFLPPDFRPDEKVTLTIMMITFVTHVLSPTIVAAMMKATFHWPLWPLEWLVKTMWWW